MYCIWFQLLPVYQAFSSGAFSFILGWAQNEEILW